MTCVFPLLPPILWLLESSVLSICVVGALSADSQTHCWALWLLLLHLLAGSLACELRK